MVSDAGKPLQHAHRRQGCARGTWFYYWTLPILGDPSSKNCTGTSCVADDALQN